MTDIEWIRCDLLFFFALGQLVSVSMVSIFGESTVLS